MGSSGYVAQQHPELRDRSVTGRRLISWQQGLALAMLLGLTETWSGKNKELTPARTHDDWKELHCGDSIIARASSSFQCTSLSLYFLSLPVQEQLSNSIQAWGSCTGCLGGILGKVTSRKLGEKA